MIDFLPFQLMRKYPHMGPADTVIWERFIRANQTYFDKVAYDVKVGTGAEFDTVVNPETGGDVAGLYKSKIDVIGVKDGRNYIIEVKPRADTRALGQVEGYLELARRDLPEISDPRPMVICEGVLPDVEYLSLKKGIEVIVV